MVSKLRTLAPLSPQIPETTAPQAAQQLSANFCQSTRGLRQAGNQLVGSPIYFFSSGSHGNIGGSILRGTRNLPDSIGRWTTSLRPIPISVLGEELTQIPGVILCAAVLMEENLTPNSAVEAAHQSTITLIKNTLNNTIASLGLAGFAADTVAESVNVGITLPVAATRVLERRLKPIQDLFTVAAPANAAVTILQNLNIAGFIGTAIDRDKPMGSFFQSFGQSELAATYESAPSAPRGQRIEINSKMWNMPEWAYTLHGQAWAHRKIVRRTLPTNQRLQAGPFHSRERLKMLEFQANPFFLEAYASALAIP